MDAILRHCDAAKSAQPTHYNRAMKRSDSQSSTDSRALPTLEALNRQIVACERCSRLRRYCEEVALRRRRQWRDWEYWGRPVPSFGDPEARVLVVGLAPGAHGSNRTGRPFTGDGSGDFLYPVLHRTGFASQPDATHRDDGLTLTDLWITAAARCAPPDNKPTPEELHNCAPWLDQEFALLSRLRVVVCLGRIGFQAALGVYLRCGMLTSRAEFSFAHGAEYRLPDGRFLLASYHPSLQNTNTGRLTEPMFRAVFLQARKLAGIP